jgi:hypothetical protein
MGIGRTSALGVNRTRRDGGNDVNDLSPPFDDQFCCNAQRGIPYSEVVGCDPRTERSI